MNGYIFTKQQSNQRCLKSWCEHLTSVGRNWLILRNKNNDYIIFVEGAEIRSANNGTVKEQSMPLGDMLSAGWQVMT